MRASVHTGTCVREYMCIAACLSHYYGKQIYNDFDVFLLSSVHADRDGPLILSRLKFKLQK